MVTTGISYWIFPQSDVRSFFEGQPACFNGVDLEGNSVEDISLVLDAYKYTVSEGGSDMFIVFPKFVFEENWVMDLLFVQTVNANMNVMNMMVVV
jgi:hypothetical protein